MSIDIVNLIENNPITKFSGDYQSKLVEKNKKSFHKLWATTFLSSFYCYLKYDSKNDFIIDLDNVWNWLGFTRKNDAKRVFEQNFLINKDYKIFAPQVGGAKKENRVLFLLLFHHLLLLRSLFFSSSSPSLSSFSFSLLFLLLLLFITFLLLFLPFLLYAN